MNNQYKQPQPQEVSQTTLEDTVRLNKTVGSLFLDKTAPTTIPTGKPINLINQIQYVLVEGSPVNAGSLSAGNIYKITTVGTSDFTLVGAKKNELNVYFTATGTTTGTGFATAYSVRLYFYIPQFEVWKYTTLS